MATSLFDRLGGNVAVLAAVDLFYKKVLDDPLTKPYFSGLDMKVQITKQVAFMTWAFGGPDEYKGRSLREAHSKLVQRGLSDPHFDAVAGHLKSTLQELGIEDALIAESLGIVAGTRSEVLGR